MPFVNVEPMKEIYTITTIRKRNVDKFGKADLNYDIVRTVGWTSNLADARYIVENNVYDLHEGRYHHIVIEHVPEGVHPFTMTEWWYQWDEKAERYIPAEKPACYKFEKMEFKGFAIG